MDSVMENLTDDLKSNVYKFMRNPICDMIIDDFENYIADGEDSTLGETMSFANHYFHPFHDSEITNSSVKIYCHLNDNWLYYKTFAEYMNNTPNRQKYKTYIY